VRKKPRRFHFILSKKYEPPQKPSWFAPLTKKPSRFDIPKIKKPPLSMVFKTVFRGC
jgi:hypothetical protein